MLTILRLLSPQTPTLLYLFTSLHKYPQRNRHEHPSIVEWKQSLPGYMDGLVLAVC